MRETILRAELRKQLAPVLDVERLLAKVMIGSAGPRDLLALGKSLDQMPKLAESAAPRIQSRSRRASAKRSRKLDPVPEASGPILAALSDTPPFAIGDGPTIRPAYDAELDELRDLSQNSRQIIAQIEIRERQRTGIASLKVRFNNVFGFYIEISKANLHNAPADYERKQTLVNAERFTTPELKDYERKVLAAEEKILEIEKRIFAEIRQKTADHAQRIRATASAIAELDVSAALAQVAAENRYARPRFSATGEMRIDAGRHPVIEKLANEEAGRFIPNDLYLNDEADQIAIITGPNMGGKSTYLRQAALIAILAQMGSFVPADAALLPIIDRIFTRIGASDNLARGRSTFMVEMTETAVILNTATPRSFVILDEIGRGTATYDGLSLAWAVVEHVSTTTRAKTLFATHYHELTELAEQLEGVRNLRVAVKEAADKIIFLRKVEPGKADRSYGIEVARLAGLPMTVIERARDVLRLHENTARRTNDAAPRKHRSPDPSLRTRRRRNQTENPRPENRRNAPRRSAALPRRHSKGDRMRVAGIMSGTSLDGIDVAIVDIAGKRINTVAHSTTPYSDAVRQRILRAQTPAEISRLNFELGELYAKAVIKACKQAKIPLESLDLIGSHGQTIYHEGSANTLQIGEASVIAERLGVPVVSDFRTRDIAAGGQGAPLVPFVDALLFPNWRRALNIGGIANITILPRRNRLRHRPRQHGDRSTRRTPHATANNASTATERSQPKATSIARCSTHSSPTNTTKPNHPKPPVANNTDHPSSIASSPPASRCEDLIATATALTAATIAAAIPATSDVIASGGGTHNRQLMAQLAAFLPNSRLTTTAEFGIDPDAKEAIAFAILAHRTWHHRTGNLPAATGARRPVILGKVTFQ